MSSSHVSLSPSASSAVLQLQNSPTYNDPATVCRFHRPKPTDPPGYGPVDDIDTYVDEYLLRLGDGNIQEYVRQYQLGFTVGKDDFNGASMFTVWYNNQVRTKWSRHICKKCYHVWNK